MIRIAAVLTCLGLLSGCYSPRIVLRSGKGRQRVDGATLQLEVVNRLRAAAMIKRKRESTAKRLPKRVPYVTMIRGKLTLPVSWKGIFSLRPEGWRCSIDGKNVPVLSPDGMRKLFLPRHFAVKEYADLMRFRFSGRARGSRLFPGVSCLPGETVEFYFFIPRPPFTATAAEFLIRLEGGEKILRFRIPVALAIIKALP